MITCVPPNNIKDFWIIIRAFSLVGGGELFENFHELEGGVMIQYWWRPGVLESLVPGHRVQLWHRQLGSTLVGTEKHRLIEARGRERERASGRKKQV
jgi:hypothetical protein